MATDQTMEPTSTRPYLIRALHEWCCDNGFTPYIAVVVDASVQVPLEFVENGEIVLNVGFDATAALRIGNDFIEFKARFSGSARDIMVPIDHVTAIFSRESGQGMAFPKPDVLVQKAQVSKDGLRAVVSLAKVAAVAAPDSQPISLAQAGADQERADAPVSATVLPLKIKPSLTRVK